MLFLYFFFVFSFSYRTNTHTNFLFLIVKMASTRTFCCKTRSCRHSANRVWTDEHDAVVIKFCTEAREVSFSRADMQTHLLKRLTVKLHNKFKGQCFTKEFVLAKFSILVQRFNAWTYLSRLPGIDMYNNYLYVPTVLELGIAQVGKTNLILLTCRAYL